MRHIVYRARRISGGPWVYGYPHPVEKGNQRTFVMTTENSSGTLSTVDIIPETLCEATGMKDRTGEMVYEGDIVRYRVTDERYTKNPRFATLLISYDPTMAKFEAGDIFWQDLNSKRLTVIGNIFDNKYLLELK